MKLLRTGLFLIHFVDREINLQWTSLSPINCKIKLAQRKVGLHNLMLYSYIMCSDRRVTVLVFFCLLITFWDIKFILLKLKLEINAWSFIFLFIYIFFYSLVFKKLVWILLLYFWNFKDLSFDSGIQGLIWRGESNFYSSFIL